MTAKSTTADAVRASVIRGRPVLPRLPVRRALFKAPTERATAIRRPQQRTRRCAPTLHLPSSLRTGLKRRGLDADTTMTELIRAAISTGLRDPGGLAAASARAVRVSDLGPAD
jgi:hypothetical protein